MSKFGNKPITIDGIKFQSMLEGSFYQSVKAWHKAGKILSYRMQVPFDLHGGIKYKLDFEILDAKAKNRFVEVKGYWTAVAKLKRKLFEADFGTLEIHTAKEPWKP